MEDLITRFIERHIDLLKYLAIAVGIAYSYYRRIVSDRRVDQLDEQRLNYVRSLTEKVIELQHAHHDECSCADPSCRAKRASVQETDHVREELEHTAKDLKDTVEKLKSRLCDVYLVSHNEDHPPKTDDNKKV